MYPWISHTLIFGFNFVKKSAAYTWTFTVVESDNTFTYFLQDHASGFSC